MQSDAIENRRPLLAHYTSEAALDSMLKTNEIWLSNPLHTNDKEELGFGIINGVNALMDNEVLAALGSSRRREVFCENLHGLFRNFEVEHLLDTYIFCMSEHADGGDGDVHHWSMYGDKGRGAAIVFDTLRISTTSGSPLLISKVQYGTRPQRIEWLKEYANILGTVFLTHEFPEDQLWLAAAAAFDAIKMKSLFIKDFSWRAEQEWRVAYLSDRDTDGLLSDMRAYAHTRDGVRPKLKFPVRHVPGVPASDLSFDRLVKEIIAGPVQASTPMIVLSVERMVSSSQPALKGRVRGSRTPFRP